MTMSLSRGVRLRGSRGRARGRVRRSSNSSGASTVWSAGWSDPVISLGPGVTGAQIVVGRAELDDYEECSIVGGFIQVTGGIRVPTAPTEPSAGYLIMGARVVPATIVTVAELPDPFNESDGDFFWYRTFPLIDNGSGIWDGSNSFSINDQIRSARRIPRDSEIDVVYTFLDADFGPSDAEVDLLLGWRLLLRVP